MKPQWILSYSEQCNSKMTSGRLGRKKLYIKDKTVNYRVFLVQMLKSVHLVHEHDYDENKSKSGEYFEVSSLYPIGEKTSSKTLCI